MIPPQVTLTQLLAGLWAGIGLGIWYSFLRPLRRHSSAFGDLLFLPAFGAAWLWLGFDICGGDLRLGNFSSLFVGWALWEGSIGMLLRPVFLLFWKIMEGLW